MNYTKKKIHLENRPLTRLIQKGPQALSNPELLTILLGKDVNWNGRRETAFDLAHRVFRKYDLKRLSQASSGELEKIFGIGKVRSAQIQAVFELGRRVASHREELNPIIETPQDVYDILGPEMQALEQEVVKVILLDSRNRVIKVEDISKGSLDTNVVHPRELFRSAIDNNAASIVILHNHPSGDSEPSEADITLTKRIVEAGNIVGIEVQDHVIVGSNKFMSFRDKGLI